jgi:hypothetical protein
MNDAEKCRQVAQLLRDGAKKPGPLSKRARMIILAERLEDVAGCEEQPETGADLAQLALSAYGHRLSAGNGASP